MVKQITSGLQGITGMVLSYFRIAINNFLDNVFSESVPAGIFPEFFQNFKIITSVQKRS